MSITPKISLVAYDDHMRDGKVFVLVPNERGRYVRTDHCVIDAECPQCKASIGEPCHNGGRVPRYWASTHVARRQAADRRCHPSLRRELPDPEVLLGEIGGLTAAVNEALLMLHEMQERVESVCGGAESVTGTAPK